MTEDDIPGQAPGPLEYYLLGQLEDYSMSQNKILIKCDNTSAINISKKPIQHSRIKHIEIRHHFIRDHIQNEDIILEFVPTEDQLVDIFTKPLNEDRFEQIGGELGFYDLF